MPEKIKYYIWFVFFAVVWFQAGMSSAFAQDQGIKTVRVAYLISEGYQEGREDAYKSGYGYEYLQKIASYTGWKYEYVYGCFEDLLQQLENGEIDMMGNLSYTRERADRIYYGEQEQGRESYYLYISGTETQISPEDISTLNGKKIGVSAGSYQEELWKNWCREKNIKCEIVEISDQKKREEALNDGTVDAVLAGSFLKRNEQNQNWIGILNFGSSSFYFGISKKREDLLKELNEAQTKILIENPLYNEEVYSRYMGDKALLENQVTSEEAKWLEQKGRNLRAGALKGYLPLCDFEEDGTMSGVIADLFAFMEERYREQKIHFETVRYDDYDQMIEDLRQGEIDIAAPVYGDCWNAENMEVSLTDSVTTTSMLMLYEDIYTQRTAANIGIAAGSPLQKFYAGVYYPKADITEYDTLKEGIRALKSKKTGSLLLEACLYNIQVNHNRELRNLNRLLLPSKVEITMAVARENPSLMTFLNKGIAAMGETEIFNSLISHSNPDQEDLLKSFIRNNQDVLITVGIVAGILLFAVLMRIKKIIIRSQTDQMTGLLNKSAAKDYITEKIQYGGVLLIIDIDNFKLVNDILGHYAGDVLIKEFADQLRKIFRRNDIVGRFGGDEFIVFMSGGQIADEVIKNKIETIQKALKKSDVLILHKEIQCSASIGVVRVSAAEQKKYEELFQQADEALYQAKQQGKSTFVMAE